MSLEYIFISILNMSMISSFVIVSVLFVRLFLLKAPKIFSYMLWTVVLIRLLCPFSFESTIGFLPSNQSPVPQNIVHMEQLSVDLPLPIISDTINENLPQGEEQFATNPLEVPITVATLLWSLGVVAMVFYSIISYIKLRKKLIGATPLKGNIYIADHIDSPFVMGIINPKIYLPCSLSNAELDFIIKHEEIHMKRLDHLTRILSFIALSIHWFNPLVWIAFVLSGKDMETSCDESVMRKINDDIRADYSEALLKFATGRRIVHPTPLAFGEGDTKDRVKNIMKYKKPVIWVSVLCIILIGVVTICFMSQRGEKNFSVVNESNSNSESVIQTATDYVEEVVADYNEIGIANDFKITEAIITNIEQMNTGTAGNNHSLNLYKLEYRLSVDQIEHVPLANGISFDNNQITEWTSNGQPCLLFYQDYTSDLGEQFIEINYTNTVAETFDQDEYLEKYGDPFTAYVMEMYGEYLSEFN